MRPAISHQPSAISHRLALVLPAAGRSTRFLTSGEGVAATNASEHPAASKKPFLLLAGQPVWRRAIEPFLARTDLVQVLMVVSPEDLDWVCERFRDELVALGPIMSVIAGGRERADSVEKGLRLVSSKVDLVAVHDAARPLVTSALVEAVAKAAIRTGAALPATPIASTIKRVGANQRVTETVSRAGLWAAQTPQIVRRDLLLRAYTERGSFQPTDEAQLIERLGHPVEIVPGEAWNLKITTRDDLELAEAILACQS